MRFRQASLFALIQLVSPLAVAQLPTAALRGTVTDSSGAAVPRATVTIQNAATGVVERRVETDDLGNLAAESLPPGDYKVTVEKTGFASQARALKLPVGRVIVLEFTLAPAGVAEQVKVTEEAPLIDRESSEIGEVIAPMAIQSLPLNGRQFADLASLVPGILPAPNFDPIKTRVFNISAGGSDGRSSNFAVDGAENSDIVNGGLLQNFTVEGIQEFRVSSSRFGAEQGRALGAAVSVVTRSGSNDFHGSYFLFFRNQGLSARDPFQAKKTDFHRAQQGFTFGGPVKENRSFFFLAFEGTNEDNLGIVNTNGAYGTFEGSFGLPYTGRLLTTRFDHHFNERHKLMLRYSFEDNFSREGIGGVRSAENGVRSTNRGSSLVVSYSSLLSPRVLNSARYHYGRFNNHLLPLSTAPEVVRPSLVTGGAFNTPQNTGISRQQFREDLAIHIPSAWGTHNLKFGVDYQRLSVDAGLEFASRGQFFFFSDAPLAETLADFAFFSVGNFAFPAYHDNIFGAYLQDDWRIRRYLTLNLGLRWDVSTNENGPDFTSQIAPLGARSRDLNNWGPRVGFALDPFGKAKTVIRGGYGIFYALPVATGPAVESAFDGRRIGFGLFFGPLNITDPFPGLTQEQISAQVFAQPQFLVLTLANHVRTPYVQQFSIGVQQEITPALAVTVDYVHNLGLKQRLGRDVNLDPLGNIGSPETILAREFGPAVAASFGPVIRTDDDGRSTYNALEISVKKTLSHRFEFLAAYTLSHAVDVGDDSIGSTAANPFDLRAERGDSNRDQRHRFVLNGLVHLPGDFQLSTITALASARPYDIVTGESLDGFSPSRPPGVTRNRGARDSRGMIASINALRTAAELPVVSTTSPRSFFFYSTDLRLLKRFRIKERVSLSGAVEVFNLFNHVNFLSNGGPTFSGVSGAQNNVFSMDFGFPRRTAGGVLGSGGPRAFQLVFRFEF